ncbi:MAG: hypothetical protein ACOVS5_00730, partial [Oligoflexus sp.]
IRRYYEDNNRFLTVILGLMQIIHVGDGPLGHLAVIIDRRQSPATHINAANRHIKAADVIRRFGVSFA